MKIRPYDEDRDGYLGDSAESKVAWSVRSEDVYKVCIVTLSDVLGISDREFDKDGIRAVNMVRALLFDALSAGMTPGALPPDGKDLTDFEKAACLSSQTFQRLTDYPSHEWTSRNHGEHAFSPVEIGLNNVILAAQRYRHRFDRGQTKRWWSVAITELEKVMAILRWWLK